MKIRINTERLEELIKDFGGYQAVQDASKDTEGKHRITSRTLYNLVSGENWRNETVSIICEILGVSPSEVVLFESGSGSGVNTHVSPQPEEDSKQVSLESE